MEDAMNIPVKEESSSSEHGAGRSSNNHAPAARSAAENDKEDCIPFHDIYSILSNYREKNVGLNIPRTDAAMSSLVPALNKIGFVQVPSAESKSVDDSVHDDKQSDADSIKQSSAAAAPIKREVQDTPAVAAAANITTKIKGRCDICDQKDGFRGYNLQTCSVCSLAVHERCYGMTLTTTKNLNFVCKACAAIGSKVEVNKPSILGKSSSTKETIRVQERPTEC
eukprot:scaffold15450_cov66-Skeletonema_marinoi.AAC.4